MTRAGSLDHGGNYSALHAPSGRADHAGMTPRPLPLLLLALFAAALPAQTVVVKLLNLSDAPFGPVLVATHPTSLSPLFDPAAPPTPALQLLSEGSHSLLESAARSLSQRDPDVSFGMFDGPAPGETAVIEIPAISYYRNVSLASPLQPAGFAGFRAAAAPGGGGYRIRDVLAWEAAETVMVHRARPSPIARAWIRYRKAVIESGLPYLTPQQRLERERCVANSATCFWRLEAGHGICGDCLPPLRPDANHWHCIH